MRSFLLFSFCSLFAIQTALCDESYETDRGYREPAVVGPAIPEEEAPASMDMSVNNTPTESVELQPMSVEIREGTASTQ